jgi:hypothetical protein
MKELSSYQVEAVSGGEGPLRDFGREVGGALRDAYDYAVEKTTDFFEWALS